MKRSEIEHVIRFFYHLAAIAKDQMDTGGEMAYTRSAQILQRHLDDSIEEEAN